MVPRTTGTAARTKPGGEASSGMAAPSQEEIPSSSSSNSTNYYMKKGMAITSLRPKSKLKAC